MFYWLKVYGLIAALVFAPASMMILSLFVWYEANRVYKRLSRLASQLPFFTTPLAISRTVSRSGGRFPSH